MSYRISMKIIFASITLVVIGWATYACAATLVVQDSSHKSIRVNDPEVVQVFYGALDNYPQTFEVSSSQPFRLAVEISVPDTEESTNNVSGIIVREVDGGGRVEEVARLNAREADWVSFYEPLGGDTYRRGPHFNEIMEEGTYLIEVSTPDNIEKYVFTIGYKKDRGHLGYLETIRRIAEMKVFFGKSQLYMIESPFVYVPLLGLLSLVGISIYMKVKKAQSVWYS